MKRLATEQLSERLSTWIGTGRTRVTFFKDNSRRRYPACEQPSGFESVVVNLDADLYSSTAFVFSQLKPRLAIDSYIYFDELNHRADELHAFDELLEAPNVTIRPLGATHEFARRVQAGRVERTP